MASCCAAVRSAVSISIGMFSTARASARLITRRASSGCTSASRAREMFDSTGRVSSFIRDDPLHSEAAKEAAAHRTTFQGRAVPHAEAPHLYHIARFPQNVKKVVLGVDRGVHRVGRHSRKEKSAHPARIAPATHA